MIEMQQNNPLHGLKLELLLSELVDFYGWKILYAALKLECFNTKPTLESSLKFLKKTEWAREKLENFYLYRFKRMPKASAAQYELKPRERGFAAGIVPRNPMVLTLESIAQMQAKASADYEALSGFNKSGANKLNRGDSGFNKPGGQHSSASGSRPGSEGRKPSTDPRDPWGTKGGA
ncbi:VF530 family DNA-binding protein [Shewanella sp. AS16]|uniref:VF530 family DNA-binding protein n=1 Tax=Shewanella sp. AS16 TaxID=2907625 RepID=UPI001F24A1F1|nr:VF530 family DNA-binding protein [Shewanella sp. AS16]MCE9687280.1 VF530 family DNA-binding protein [Shewanella sp. AS16]